MQYRTDPNASRVDAMQITATINEGGIALRVMFMALCAVGLYLFSPNQVVVAGQMQNQCALPSSLGDKIAKQYPGTRVVTRSDLDEHNRRLFQKDHGDRGPGLVRVNFYGDGKPTLALVLLVGEGTGRKEELVVAHQVGQDWEFNSLDNVDASEVPVIWRQRPGKYEDITEPKAILAKNPVIVICGYEVWARLYAWTGKGVEKVQLSD
jgi:hypothetical protein